MRLKDQVAIVTGGARGLGQAFSVCLAREGAHVVVADKLPADETVRMIRSLGKNALGISVDVTSAESTRMMADATVEAFGGIDILVNNAAIYGGLKFKPMEDIAEAEWDAVFAVNVKGIWLCCKAVIPHMKKQNSGSIVNLSSASILEGLPNLGHYVASKGAVWAYTRSLARELGGFGIRVNSLMPGYTMTQASKDLSDDPELLASIMDRVLGSRIRKRDMLPEDLTGALIFLASADSSFITGQNINVDGGSCHY